MSELLERVLDNNNLNQAYLKVKANKGVGGVDGMDIDTLLEYLKENGESIKQKHQRPQIQTTTSIES